jgi:hypothetical protein
VSDAARPTDSVAACCALASRVMRVANLIASQRLLIHSLLMVGFAAATTTSEREALVAIVRAASRYTLFTEGERNVVTTLLDGGIRDPYGE